MANVGDDKDWRKITLHPLKDNENNDGGNNFSEFREKAIIDLEASNLWKYVDGPEYSPPIIPDLIPAMRINGQDDAGNLSYVNIPGNEAEVAAAIAANKDWMDANKRVLSIISKAIPNKWRFLVKHKALAHDAWRSLCAEFEPSNKRLAMDLKRQITTMQCGDEEVPLEWRVKIQRLYDRLVDLDPYAMSDEEFAKQLIINMPRTAAYRYCRDSLTELLENAMEPNDPNNPRMPLSSTVVIQRLRREEQEKGKTPAQIELGNLASGNGRGGSRKNNPLMTPTIMTADHSQLSLQERISDTPFVGNSGRDNRKQGRQDHRFTPYQGKGKGAASGAAGAGSADGICDNAFCENPGNHMFDNCFYYKGGRAGKYPSGWQGKRDLHLSPEERLKSKREESLKRRRAKGAGRSNNFAGAAGYHDTGDDRTMLNTASDEFAFIARIDGQNDCLDEDEIRFDEVVGVHSSALQAGEVDNSCNHDTGATRHIFHDRKAFSDYELLPDPIEVRGFGEKLSALAIGKGTVRLQATHEGVKRTFTLSNALHIPTARCNLISGTRLDRKGVLTKTGNGSITYFHPNLTPFANGKIVKELYKMNVETMVNEEESDHAALIAHMIPAVDDLFGRDHDSVANRRLGFTTV